MSVSIRGQLRNQPTSAVAVLLCLSACSNGEDTGVAALAVAGAPSAPSAGPSSVAMAGSGPVGEGGAGAVGPSGPSSEGMADSLALTGSSGATSAETPVAPMTPPADAGGASPSEPMVGTLHVPWDWAGVVGTGQSLAVGDPGAASRTPAATVRATTQPFQNLKLSTGNLPWPVNPNDPALAMVPLVEPVGRSAPTYPSAWPQNISGETPHTVMGSQITSLVQAAGGTYVNVQGNVGENGQCLTFLVKGATPRGVNGRAYEATLIETRAITRLAAAQGKTYGVGAITVTHGECDAGNVNYEQQLHALWADYRTDLPAITGQTEPPLLIVSQQNSGNSVSALAQWKIGVDFPADAVCSGPKYQYPYSADAVHLIVDGYERLGEKYGQVYYERVVAGHDWQPLQPTGVQRAGRVVSVRFHVPVPPLVWHDAFPMPHQTGTTAWSAGRGFELRSGNTPLAISSVEISGDAVLITAAADLPANGLSVGYALTANPAPMPTPFAGTVRWGQLRDSDPFVGSTTKVPQPNFTVAFQLPVP